MTNGDRKAVLWLHFSPCIYVVAIEISVLHKLSYSSRHHAVYVGLAKIWNLDFLSILCWNILCFSFQIDFYTREASAYKKRDKFWDFFTIFTMEDDSKLNFLNSSDCLLLLFPLIFPNWFWVSRQWLKARNSYTGNVCWVSLGVSMIGFVILRK